MLLSIAIPTFEYGGRGGEVLEYSFRKMLTQTFQDFNVVVSDHSKNDDVENVCKFYSDRLSISYCRNEKDIGSGASNFNNAIRLCDGTYIKLLCQDDYLFGDRSLELTMLAIDGRYWLASAYWHTYDRVNLERIHFPGINPMLYAVNTIGTPSGVTLRNLKNETILFDKSYSYCYDCEFYWRFLLEYGKPVILYDPTVVNYLWNESSTTSLSQELIERETLTLMQKYGRIK